jgi:peptide/nickel transport system permease protein
MTGRRIRIPFAGDPLARFGTAAIILIVLGCLVGALLPGFDGTTTVAPRFQPPSPEFPLGTDALGRNVLPRLLDATGTTVLISLAAVLISTLVAVVLGVAAGIWKGVVDQIAMRVADGLFAFPAMLLSILISAIVGAGEFAAVASIVIITLPLMMRVFRGATVDIEHRDFVTSSKVGGAGRVRVAVRHILPNIGGSIAVQATYAASIAMLIEGGLSFLGFGVVPPAASLGSLVQEGSVYLTVFPWLAIAPGVVLALAIFSLNAIGDGISDDLEPRKERSLR